MWSQNSYIQYDRIRDKDEEKDEPTLAHHFITTSELVNKCYSFTILQDDP